MTSTALFHLYDVPRVVRFIRKNKMMVARGWVGRNGKLVFNRDRAAVWEDKRVLELHSVNCYRKCACN